MTNRPDWCPSDVWLETGMKFDQLYDAEPNLEGGCEYGVRQMAARMVVAERERCVKAVKESMMLHYMSIGTGNSAIAKIMGAEE